jgi:Clr5-like protein
MTFNWEEVKDDIERLYMKEGKSLKEVRKILKDTRNFSAW